MTDLRALAEAAREDGTTPIFYNEATVASFAAFHYKARLANAASPAVILALLDVVDAARGLVDIVEPADIPTLSREQLDAFLAILAALARVAEVTK